MTTSRLFEVFAFTLLQAGLSSLLALVFGILSGLGLLSITGRRSLAVWRALAFLPSVFPPLFLIIACLGALGEFFPFGLWGIVLLHTLQFFGLVAWAFERRLRERHGTSLELAWTEGAPLSLWLGCLLRGPLGKYCLWIFLVVFTQTFASLSVPLIVGGGADTWEVYLYAGLREGQGLLIIFYLSLVPMAMQVFAALALGINDAPGEVQRSDGLGASLGKKSGLIPLLLPVGACVWVMIEALPKAIPGLLELVGFTHLVFSAMLGTVLLSILTGILLLLSLGVWAYWAPWSNIERKSGAWPTPSTVLVALGLMGFTAWFGFYAITSLGLLVLTLPSLLKGWLIPRCSELKAQWTVAKVLGAEQKQIFWEITWPQVRATVGQAAGLGALWAAGDFALSGLFANRAETLSLLIENLMSAYRLPLATLLLWPLLAIGGFSYFACIRWARVIG